MKRSIDIPDTLYKQLKTLADEKFMSVAALIKLACVEYLENQKKKK